MLKTWEKHCKEWLPEYHLRSIAPRDDGHEYSPKEIEGMMEDVACHPRGGILIINYDRLSTKAAGML